MLDFIAEKAIQDAIARGELDDLPGAGRPLELDDDALVPEELRLACRILKNAGYVPAEVQALGEIAQLEALVTSADVETLAGAPLPWANAETGARGQVTGIVETKGKGTLCRSFSASRESFDGIGMYRGEACMVASGAWRMQRFESL